MYAHVPSGTFWEKEVLLSLLLRDSKDKLSHELKKV